MKKNAVKAWWNNKKIRYSSIALVCLLVVIGIVVARIMSNTTTTIKGATSSKVSDYKKQLPALKSAVEKNSKDPENRKEYAVALYATGDVSEAKKQYEEAIKVKQNDATLYNNLGNMQRDLREYDAAVKSYKKALELDPRLVNTYINLANTQLYMKNRVADAIRTYKEGLRVLPENNQIEVLLGIAYVKAGDTDSAKVAFNNVLKRDANNTSAKLNLERLEKK